MTTVPLERRPHWVAAAALTVVTLAALIAGLLIAPADATRVRAEPAFKVATWNVHYATPTRVLRPVLHQLEGRRVTILLMQEAGGRDISRMLRAEGWRTRVHGQYRIGWRPERWRLVRAYAARPSRQEWYSVVHKRMTSVAVIGAVLEDRKTGRTVDVVSYHLPAGLQKPGGPPARRKRVVQQHMTWLGQWARRSPADAQLAGGDDNVDERGCCGPWPYMRVPGLPQVQAPAWTHGGHRRIDDFRLRGLVVGHGTVIPGGGDHRVHVRRLAWPPPRPPR